MRYLILTPDYNNHFLYDEFDDNFDIQTLKLPYDFEQKMITWNLRYNKIFSLSVEQRKLKIKMIEDLDNQGISIAHDLKKFMLNEVKIKYFSDNKLGYIQI